MLTFKVKIFCVHLQEIYLPMRKSAAREESDHTNKHQGMKCETSEDSWGVEKKEERAQRKETFMAVCVQLCSSVSGQSVLLAASACTITSSLTGLPGRPAATAHPPALLLLLLKQPRYVCVSSEWPATSYLSAGMGSFMSAGHRFNTGPVGGMTGGLAGWWTACLLVEAVLLSDWTPFWRCWGHRRQTNQNELLGNSGH